eukprot:gnl/Dysnectes_brevis/4543_a6155_572.p1 GENE.gnl/Dysnectes_brevis/4543_a6155_572~~gnl/Dysnectes_brevis/4543_a6155_572.p1  ORF type:complete len:306 (-),score=9.09 gnl/Dysnectes_brevis/4543_a6155_572:111-1007(-)
MASHQGNYDRQFDALIYQVERSYVELSTRQRIFAEKWIKKLMTPQIKTAWKKNRNLYAELLLHYIRKGSLDKPFNRLPPDTVLPTLPSYLRMYTRPKRTSSGMRQTRVSMSRAQDQEGRPMDHSQQREPAGFPVRSRSVNRQSTTRFMNPKPQVSRPDRIIDPQRHTRHSADRSEIMRLKDELAQARAHIASLELTCNEQRHTIDSLQRCVTLGVQAVGSAGSAHSAHSAPSSSSFSAPRGDILPSRRDAIPRRTYEIAPGSRGGLDLGPSALGSGRSYDIMHEVESIHRQNRQLSEL